MSTDILTPMYTMAKRIPRSLRFMEVCGTHTVAAFRCGLHSLLPNNLLLLSGPGCPVCVTPNDYLDFALALAQESGTMLATFGDMMRVPGTTSSLEKARSQGARILVVYSPQEALATAEQNSSQQVILLGVGFETTAPAVAWTIQAAAQRKIANFSVLSAHKTVPLAMAALLSSNSARLDGFLCPGHVSVIIGANAYDQLCHQYHIPCVVAGFEPFDMVQAITMLLKQVAHGQAKVQIQYQRSVRKTGNPAALKLMQEVFEPCDAQWRGLGLIPQSGLKIRSKYAEFDAEQRFAFIQRPYSQEPVDCRCGEVLRSICLPSDCPWFAHTCTPAHPMGACMVASEGTCAAYYKYKCTSVGVPNSNTIFGHSGEKHG